jgi:purine-binding chemotaxis protein CheW
MFGGELLNAPPVQADTLECARRSWGVRASTANRAPGTRTGGSDVSANGTATTDNAERYLTFRLADTTYAVGVLKVQEIIGAMAITAVPGTPAHVRGVINLRGRVIPVVDLRTRFGMPALPDSDRTCIVITQVSGPRGEATVGVVVEDVAEVVDLPAAIVEEVPEFGLEIRTDYLTGVARREQDVVLLLDIDTVLTREEAELMEELGDDEHRQEESR